MLRIAGINIADNRQIYMGLADIFGIGPSSAKKLLVDLKIDPATKSGVLTDPQIEQIRGEVAKIKIEGDLRSQIQQDIKHHTSIQSYRGVRHSKKLPVHGQRTKTNARTKRGRRVTVGSGRKPTGQKT